MSAVTGISGIQLSAASAAYAPTNSAEVSAIASAYATGKQDALTFGYDAESSISSINGSSLAGGGATGDYVEKSAVPLEIGSSISATNTSVAIGSMATAKDLSVAIGRIVSATDTSVALGGRASAGNGSFSFGWYSTAVGDSVTMGYYAGATYNSIALGYASQANASAVAVGRYLRAGSKNNVFGDYNSTANSANTVFSIGDGTANTARHNLLEITKDGEITMYSSTADTVGTGIMSSIRALSANAGGVDSATVSAIASSYAESAASSKLDESATADFYSTSNPSGFVDSAYVDSAVSGKADSSALSSYVPYSSLEYNTASAISGINGSALAAGSTYSAGEGIDITDDVISVEAPVDIVAGPGIVIDNPDGNTLRVSVAQAEEVVLWEGSIGTNSSASLSESWHNFEIIKVYGYSEPGGGMAAEARAADLESAITDGTNCADINLSTVSSWVHRNEFCIITSLPVVFTANTTVTTMNGRLMGYWNGQWQVSFSETRTHVTKIVGIHRIANN